MGDIDMAEVDDALLRYLGTVAARPEAARQLPPARPAPSSATRPRTSSGRPGT